MIKKNNNSTNISPRKLVKAKVDMWIGIDPDVDESGFSTYCPNANKIISLEVLSFFDCLEKINELRGEWPYDKNICIAVEAGHLIKKSNWHGVGKNMTAQSRSLVMQKMANSVGRNNQVGVLFVEFLKRNKIMYEEIKPQGKIKSPEFKRITGWTGRSSEEKRDAAMLVFGKPDFKLIEVDDNG